jgi:hypothetical protein
MVGHPGVRLRGDLPVALLKLGGVAGALGLEQLPEGLSVHVARRFHRRE